MFTDRFLLFLCRKHTNTAVVTCCCLDDYWFATWSASFSSFFPLRISNERISSFLHFTLLQFFSFLFSFLYTKWAILRHHLGLSHYNVSHFSHFFPIPVGGFPNTLRFQLHAFFATTVSSFVLCTKTKEKSSYESESWSLTDESSSFKGQFWFLAMLVHFVLQRLLSTIWLWVSE